jgi:acyl-CoA thioesterase FadM
MPPGSYQTVVREEWLDYNGHMNDAYYALVCGEASEVLLDALGLGAAYQAATGCTTYTVESHIRYLAEARGGDVLRAVSVLVAADPKRLRVRHSISGPAGAVATGEYLYLHVNQASGRVEPMPADRWSVVEAVLATGAASSSGARHRDRG